MRNIVDMASLQHMSLLVRCQRRKIAKLLPGCSTRLLSWSTRAPKRNQSIVSRDRHATSPEGSCQPLPAHLAQGGHRASDRSRHYTTSRDDIPKLGHRVVVRTRKHDDNNEVVDISINNVRKLNSLDSALISELTDAFSMLKSNSKVRCVTLRGESNTTSQKQPSFCAGANLVEMSEITTSDDAKSFISRLSELCTAVRDCPVPVIAAINGFCFGAGLELAASCDVRYATMSSKFSMPEVAVGIPSVIQARLLVDIMGWANARYLMLFGKTLDADQAYQQGLLNDLFSEQADMDKRVQEDIEVLIKCGPLAVRSQKALMRSWESTDVDGGIQNGVDAFARMWDDGGKEPREYMSRALKHLKSRKANK